MIYITSDLHFFHDKEFIYKPRGFNSEEEMRNYYINEWKNKIKEDDDLYILGDLCLGKDLDKIKELLISLPGKIHLIIGNHDTDNKIELYKSLSNFIEIVYATRIKYKDHYYYLSHYITDTSSLETDPKYCLINLHGHTHSKYKFYEERPYIYNVSVDSNNNKFITLEEINNEFNNQVQNCINYL